MPQKAVTPEGKPVLAFLYKDKFQIVDRYSELLCPHCKCPVAPRQGRNKSIRLHFYHKNRDLKCQTNLLHHPESPEHETGKVWIYEFILEGLSQRKDREKFSIEFEFPIPKCGKHGRIADVALLRQGKLVHIFECQFSPISQEQITERIQDYNEKAENWWFLGGAANTDENRKAIIKYTHFLGFANIESGYSDPNAITDAIFGAEDNSSDISKQLDLLLDRLSNDPVQAVSTLGLSMVGVQVFVVDTSDNCPLRPLTANDVVAWLDTPASIAAFNPFTVRSVLGEFVYLGWVHHKVHYSRLSPIPYCDPSYSKSDRGLYCC